MSDPPSGRSGQPAHRLFFALPLEEACRRQIENHVQALLLESPDLRSSGTWTRTENLHITLRFLGAVSIDRLPAVLAAGEVAVCGRSPITCRLNSYGSFAGATRSTPVWCGVDSTRELVDLAGAIDASLEKVGWARERRPFSAHITLARIRMPAVERRVLAALRRHPLDVSFSARKVILYQSELDPQGPRYIPLATFVLTGSPDTGAH